MGNELKPCPMCDGKAELIEYSINTFVRCTKCKLSTDDSGYSSIEKWNTRSKPHPSNDIKTIREAFEKWAVNVHPNSVHKKGNEYAFAIMQDRWEGWQAALTNLERSSKNDARESDDSLRKVLQDAKVYIDALANYERKNGAIIPTMDDAGVVNALWQETTNLMNESIRQTQLNINAALTQSQVEHAQNSVNIVHVEKTCTKDEHSHPRNEPTEEMVEVQGCGVNSNGIPYLGDFNTWGGQKLYMKKAKEC